MSVSKHIPFINLCPILQKYRQAEDTYTLVRNLDPGCDYVTDAQLQEQLLHVRTQQIIGKYELGTCCLSPIKLP